MSLMIQQGWQCPCCSKVYSPTTPMCFYCPPKVTVASNSTPQREWVGLTDEDKASFWKADQMTHEEWQRLFAEVEAKLKEKNT